MAPPSRDQSSVEVEFVQDDVRIQNLKDEGSRSINSNSNINSHKDSVLPQEFDCINGLSTNWNCSEESANGGNSSGYDTVGAFGIIRPLAGPDCDSKRITSLEKLGIQRSVKPAHPSFSSYESRLSTYSSWPANVGLNPPVLSDAGFYFTGSEDKVICFHCGGGLNNWEPTDDPWIEHALWFSKCTFLLLRKGQEFVQAVQDKQSPLITVGEAKEILSEINKMTVSSGNSSFEVRNVCTTEKVIDENTRSSKEANPNKERSELSRECKICFTEEMSVVFLPCGHVVACVKCAASLSTCPVCRQQFSGTARIYLS